MSETVSFDNVRYIHKYKAYQPMAKLANDWIFTLEDYGNELSACLEANLADAIARVAESNGMTQNDIQHLFPSILRILKSKSQWSK